MVHGWMPLSLFVIVKVLSTAAAIGWTIPCGPTEIAEHITWRHSSWFKKKEEKKQQKNALSQHGIWDNIVIFTQNRCQYWNGLAPQYLCDTFNANQDIHNHNTRNAVPTKEYGYLGKQKICLYFPTSTCEHLWPSPCIIHGHTTWF